MPVCRSSVKRTYGRGSGFSACRIASAAARAAATSASDNTSGSGLITDCWMTGAAGSLPITPDWLSQRKNDLSDVTRREYVLGLHFFTVFCQFSHSLRSRVVIWPTLLPAPRYCASWFTSPPKALIVCGELSSFSRCSSQVTMAALSGEPALSAGAARTAGDGELTPCGAGRLCGAAEGSGASAVGVENRGSWSAITSSRLKAVFSP